jgi:ribosomal protein S18 acetylase RimI-like enzyme
MTHVLDNPIWNALNTGSAPFATGDDTCKFILPEKGYFAGIPAFDAENLLNLHSKCRLGQRVILFPPGRISVGAGWNVLNDHELLQMVCTSVAKDIEEGFEVKALGEKDIPAMLVLTELTKPGPFISRTIDFGGYMWIYRRGQLVSMAGKRLSPDPYVEVSAVCTHPDFLGKGLSAKVIQRVIKEIQAEGKTPFLHVYPENTPAIKVYSKLGFQPRSMLRVYLLEKKI